MSLESCVPIKKGFKLLNQWFRYWFIDWSHFALLQGSWGFGLIGGMLLATRRPIAGLLWLGISMLLFLGSSLRTRK